MDLITVIITLALVGVLVWAIVTYLPMPAAIQRLIIIVVVIVLVLWVLNLLGVIPAIRIPTVGGD